jgi:hypothetical protein
VTLTEFLLARIAEDEREADQAGSFTPWTDAFQRDNYGHLTVQPARVLAECAAKRAIVEDLKELEADYKVSHSEFTEARRFQALVSVARLAAVYADHPDYDETWRP